MEITPGTKNSHFHPIHTHEHTKQKGMVLCLARKVHYLIIVCSVSITQRHIRIAHVHMSGSSVMRDGYPPGAGDQLGQEHQTMPQSAAAAAHWECGLSVCVCEFDRERKRARQAAKQPPPDQKMFPCTFSKHSLWGLYFFLSSAISVRCSLRFYFPSLLSSSQPFFFFSEVTVGGQNVFV